MGLKKWIPWNWIKKDCTITVEVPGVDEKDVKVEIANDTLTIRGEKKQEKKEKEKNYHRMEPIYGSFQRVLTMPGDVDRGGLTATFKNGVLNITIPRLAIPQANARRIKVKSA